MKDDELSDLANYFEELSRETDRGLPLVAAAVIDEKLLATLEAFMCDGRAAQRLLREGNAPLSTFSARIDAAFALGLIDDHEYLEITLIRKIRNLFAHARHGLSFDDKTIVGLCMSLNSAMPEDDRYKKAPARFRFVHAAVTITMRLFYRHKWVGQEQRKPKVWVTPEDMRWRDIKDEPPKSGSFISLALQGARIGIVQGVSIEKSPGDSNGATPSEADQ